MRLALFDLDHTLLDGDSDQLWCDFLIDKGLLDKAIFSAKNEAMARDYKTEHKSIPIKLTAIEWS